MIDNTHEADDDLSRNATAASDWQRSAGRESECADDETVCATLERYADAPDELTLYPADADGFELTVTWVTAREGSFVTLAEMR